MSTEIEALRADLVAAVQLVEQLDHENEHLRQRLLETIGWWEDDVHAHVERELALHEQNANLEREITALHRTLTMRVARPLRSLTALIRNKLQPKARSATSS